MQWPRYAVDGGPSKTLNREAFGASHVPQRDITNVPDAVNAPNALLKRLKESLKAETELAWWCIWTRKIKPADAQRNCDGVGFV
jgi:di/tripeptidase